MNYKKQISFDEWDNTEKRLELIKQSNRVSTFWPTEEEMEIMRENPRRWIILACYLYEQGDKPTTDDELVGKRMVQQFINDHLELSDDEPVDEP